MSKDNVGYFNAIEQPNILTTSPHSASSVTVVQYLVAYVADKSHIVCFYNMVYGQLHSNRKV